MVFLFHYLQTGYGTHTFPYKMGIWDYEHVGGGGERRGVYRVLVGKPEGKRPLESPRRRWEDNTKMDLQKVECGGMDWIDLSQDRYGWRELVNAVMNLMVP
jgi:hypothetical protein